MTLRKILMRGSLALGSLIAIAAAAYGTYAAITWYRYGSVDLRTSPRADDPLLDRFIPTYDVVERHRVRVDAPAAITFAAMQEADVNDSAVVRAIFKVRQVVLRAEDDRNLPHGLIAQTLALGWRILAEAPDKEIVMGAVTQPWLGNVVFRGLSPEEFATFDEPGYVKIAWTLRADPIGETESEAITETRVVTTDAYARDKFRRYWAYVSPGVELIRKMSLRLVRREAERRYRAAANSL